MHALREDRYVYISGEPVELWENSHTPFGWSDDDLETYARNGDWELLFNALVLAYSPVMQAA
jgi:hypothetical protein